MASSARRLLLASLLVCFLIDACYGTILFSSLQKTLQVSTSTRQGVLKAGDDRVRVTWSLNQTLSPAADSTYDKVSVKLCFAPVSQKDRAWRKTEDLLSKDKTCSFKMETKPYQKNTQSADWLIERDIPTGSYFVRVYALNADGHEVAFGQSTDDKKTSNFFEIQAITGRHASLDIASICFSAFSVVSLFGFFFYEKRKARMSQK